MTPFTSRDVQRFLEVSEDGVWGEQTELAARAKLNNPKDETGRPWGRKRLVYGVQQAMLVKAGFKIDVDGYLGPQTLDAFERYQNGTKADTPKVNKASLDWWSSLKAWWFKDDEPSHAQGVLRPEKIILPAKPKLVMNEWPRQKDAEEFFGPKGENQTRIQLPFKMKLAWDPKTEVTTMVCHKKVAPSVARVLQSVKQYYGDEGIKELGLDRYGGCLNVRQVRGGNTWSMHSWGIAIDFDPDRNQLRWSSERARLAKDDARFFWDCWEAEGWVSLGRERNFDWMHVQAARL